MSLGGDDYGKKKAVMKLVFYGGKRRREREEEEEEVDDVDVLCDISGDMDDSVCDSTQWRMKLTQVKKTCSFGEYRTHY